jgi:hypothetical protein
MKKQMLKHVIDSRLGAATASRPKIPTYQFRGCDQRLPSKADTVGVAAVQTAPVYTGNNIIGIATMHKSNAVPVFSEQEAVDISHMRR